MWKTFFFSPEQIKFNFLQKNKDLFSKSYTNLPGNYFARCAFKLFRYMNAMSDLSKNVKNLFFSPEQINFNSLQKNKDLFPKSYTTKTIHFIFVMLNFAIWSILIYILRMNFHCLTFLNRVRCHSFLSGSKIICRQINVTLPVVTEHSLGPMNVFYIHFFILFFYHLQKVIIVFFQVEWCHQACLDMN